MTFPSNLFCYLGKGKVHPTHQSKNLIDESGNSTSNDPTVSFPLHLKKQEKILNSFKRQKKESSNTTSTIKSKLSYSEGQMKISSDTKNSVLYRHSSHTADKDLGIIPESPIGIQEKKHHYTTTIPLSGSTNNAAAEVIVPVIQDLMKQTNDPSVLEALNNVIKMLDIMAVDAETLLDRSLKEILDKNIDPEFKEYLELEFRPKTEPKISDEIDGNAIQRSGESQSAVDTKSIDFKLPPDLLKKYRHFQGSFDPKSWDLATLKIEQHPILFMGIWIYEETGLASLFQLEPEALVQFLISIELHYHDENPYHNKFHGADVLQASYYFCNVLEFQGKQQLFSKLELLSLYFAATVHDVDHPGLNNNFMETTDDPLAILYNNQAVLENHHSCLAFKLHEKYPVFSKLTRSDYRRFRELSLTMVLATDFKTHFGFISELKTKIVSGACFDANRLNYLKLVIKSADISNCTRINSIYLDWCQRICEEFFEQGDIEKDLGLPISPFMDRRTTQVHKAQIGFIDFVARPLFSAFHALFPIPNLMDNLESNKRYWEEEGAKLKISLRVSVKVLAIARRKRREKKSRSELNVTKTNHLNVDNMTFMNRLKNYTISEDLKSSSDETKKQNLQDEGYKGMKIRNQMGVVKASMAFMKKSV